MIIFWIKSVDMDIAIIPEGWPGNIWLEGKTIVHLQDGQERPSTCRVDQQKRLVVDF